MSKLFIPDSPSFMQCVVRILSGMGTVYYLHDYHLLILINGLFLQQQDGLLCGQHCLNNLLQGQYFSAVDLADIAQQMDQAEQQHMAEQGVDTEEFRRFMEVKIGMLQTYTDLSSPPLLLFYFSSPHHQLSNLMFKNLILNRNEYEV